MKRIAAFLASLALATCALAQVPIYTRPSANVSGTSPVNVTFDASDVFQAEDSLTAFATGGQTSATQMSATKSYHRFTTVVTAGDSGKLPAATVGQAHYVRNDGANAMQVFGQATETINGVASATGISQAPGMGVWYICTTAGAWTTSPVSTITATTQFRAPNGSASTVGYGFSNTNTGWWASSSGVAISAAIGGTNALALTASVFNLNSGVAFGWSSGDPTVAANDVILARDAANTLAQKNSTTAQEFRIYGTTTGPKYLSLKHDGTNAVIDVATTSSGNILLGTSGASPLNQAIVFNTAGGVAPAFNFQNAGTTRYAFKSGGNTQGSQISITQNAAPTCTSNCGTSPSIQGSDTAMIVTMGASGVPASGWVVTFNGTWVSAPSCIVQSALSTMVVGKMPIAIQTTTTTATVTTNGTAPANSDKYNIQCIGVS